jgi:hypothetical protein
VDSDHGGGTFRRTCNYLHQVQGFHKNIVHTFHPNSYAHYGADPAQRSFGEVIWEIDDNCANPTGWKDWPIINDNRQGTLELVRWDPIIPNKALYSFVDTVPKPIHARILPPAAPGDQTVSVRSADYQLRSGMFKGVFRQTGYEHQSSYADPRAIASTLYSIVRIAQKATWKC